MTLWRIHNQIENLKEGENGRNKILQNSYQAGLDVFPICLGVKKLLITR